ncbi:Transcription factor TFIIIB component B'' [Glycine max]|nr:Transcription factor TFIIIB component B'' [Glycine max]
MGLFGIWPAGPNSIVMVPRADRIITLLCLVFSVGSNVASFDFILFLSAKFIWVCCKQGKLCVLISCLMDPFDDILPVAPTARTRPGAKFIPKAKSKQLPRKEIPVSEHATSSKDGILGNECQNAVASAEESKGFIHHTQVEIPNSGDSTNSKQASVKGDTAALVDDSTITASEVDANQNSINFLKPACEVTEGDPVDFEGVNNGTTQPVHHANAVENELNNVAAPSPTCSTIDRMKEQPKNGEDSFLDSNKCLELIDNSILVGMDLGFKSSSDDKIAIIQSNFDLKSNFCKKQEGVSAEFELDPFSNILPNPVARNVNQSTSLPLPTSEILRTTELPKKFDDSSSSIPFSEDNKSLAAAIPSQLDSPNVMLSEDAVHNGTTDWSSSFRKSPGEAADIFSGLESLHDFITQAATGTGKPALHSFNGKSGEENFVTPASSSINSFGECDITQAQRCPEYHTPQDSLTFNEAAVLNEDNTHSSNRRSETEEIVDLNPACAGDDVIDYQFMKSGKDPTGIPVHEELTNAADSPTLADFLHADVTREKEDSNKRKNDGSTSCSLRKKRRFIAGEEDKGAKTSRQLRKQAAHKPANSSFNEDVEDNNDLDPPYNSNGDELQENDDDYEVNYPSRKKRVSKSSQKKSMAKSGKTSQKPKKAYEDLEKTEEPLKKFSHSTRRKKRCVDKALLEIPEDELDRLRIPIKDIILLEEHRERLAKKEAMTSNISSTNQSGGDSLHEAGAYNEGAYNEGAYDDGAYNDGEFLGSEDGRDPYDDQANEGIASTSVLLNYQSFREKTPRGKWSKQETELFYEAVREMGTDFSMIQEIFFPNKSRHQIKLKYKNEERQQPLQLTDAVNNRAKDHPHSKLFIERLQLASAKAEDPCRDASDFVMAEEVVDLTAGTNEEVAEVATTKEDADVKEQEDSVAVPSPEQSDDSEDDFQRWSQYKSGYQ